MDPRSLGSGAHGPLFTGKWPPWTRRSLGSGAPSSVAEGWQHPATVPRAQEEDPSRSHVGHTHRARGPDLSKKPHLLRPEAWLRLGTIPPFRAGTAWRLVAPPPLPGSSAVISQVPGTQGGLRWARAWEVDC